MRHEKGEVHGQKMMKSGKGGKMPHNDKMSEEHSKSMGSAKPGAMPMSAHCNTPEGQKLVG